MESPIVGKGNKNSECFDIWDSNDLGVELCFSFMCLLFIIQAIYASTKKAKIAVQFDIAMAIGCALPLGIWLEQHWLV